jgi:uncharacterized protein (DUF433 family)
MTHERPTRAGPNRGVAAITRLRRWLSERVASIRRRVRRSNPLAPRKPPGEAGAGEAETKAEESQRRGEIDSRDRRRLDAASGRLNAEAADVLADQATWQHPDIHSGDEIFAGTRVPVSTFAEILLHGGTIEEFLVAFPSVQRWQAEAVVRDRIAPVTRGRRVGRTTAPGPGADGEQRSRLGDLPPEDAAPLFAPSVYAIRDRHGIVLEAFLSLESALKESHLPPLDDGGWSFAFDLSGEAVLTHAKAGIELAELPIVEPVVLWAVEQRRYDEWSVSSLHWTRQSAEDFLDGNTDPSRWRVNDWVLAEAP